MKPQAAPGPELAHRRAALAGAALAGLAGLAGCAQLPSPDPIRIDVLHDDRGCPATLAPVLLVLLPGVNMPPSEMLREGMVDAVRRRGLAVDVRIADAHIGFVRSGNVRQRLREDVLAPARAQGYRSIWLAGISLGGFVALAYAMQSPGEVDGVLAIAPYLGPQPLVREIVAAGGPAAWRGSAQARSADDIDHALWMWLSALPAGAPQLWLAHGSEDRFVQGHRVLAGLLPPERVSVAPGGHTWAPWRALWDQWLASAPLPRRCAAV